MNLRLGKLRELTLNPEDIICRACFITLGFLLPLAFAAAHDINDPMPLQGKECLVATISYLVEPSHIDPNITTEIALKRLSAGLQMSENIATHKWMVEPMTSRTAHAAYPLIYESYKTIGIPVKNADSLMEFEYVLTFRSKTDATVQAVAMFKNTRSGAKLGLVASDGSKENKTRVRSLIRNISKVNGVYAEVSLKPAEIAYLANDVFTTPYPIARLVLAPKLIRRPSEAEFIENLESRHMTFHTEILWNSYIREIEINGAKTPVLKVMIGHPIVPRSLLP